MAPGAKGDPGDMASVSSSAEGDAIKVYVRVRPPADGDRSLCLSVLSTSTIRLLSKPEPKIFTFDHVADVDTTQESVFSSVAKNIVESCMNGYNGTIFAYGQTGSGKTFTMMGPPDSDNFTHNLRGVIPRSFEYLFFLIEREKEKAGTGKSFLCKCSFIEIYNEQIFDLLDSASAGLFLREHITKGVFVVGAVEQVLTSAAEAYQVLTMGWRNRRVASTSMNRESSRSHAVFTIIVESIEKNNEITNIRSSHLNLVDLAGSERQKDTHTEGARLKEAGNINRSLSCLGQVMTALVDVGNGKQRHICYRNSRLTFLLRDSLGGNAKTSIIANVHPGSRCFGETLSTLNFAQRAKLIKNKAVINEDTQGNVRQLQSEVKKLKEQLALLAAGQLVHDAPLPSGTIMPDVGSTDYRSHFLDAMLFLEKSESERKILLEKVSQLEDLCVKKEKFIQSNKMIIKFREGHITRLEKLHKEACGSFSVMEQEEMFKELKQELKIFKDQVEQHPRVAKYAMENHILREENKQLRSLQSVKRAQEMDIQTRAELEKMFFDVSGREGNNKGQQACSVSTDSNTAVSVERLKERLLHAQSELASCKQEHEEFKELTKKKQMELESELQSVQKANQHLEKILEATKACKRQEVSYLNKMHRETLKNITTPTKAYQLRSRLVPRSTPEMLNQESPPSSAEVVDDIFNEPMPPEMTEQAYEAITEELGVVQKELSALQIKLDAEETKSLKLQQHINKLEHHSSQMEELFASERSEWLSGKHKLLEKIDCLEKKYKDTKNQADILKNEVHDLRIVLKSADKELAAAKTKYDTFRGNQEKEIGELSVRHMNLQLQLDNVRLEYEKVLEEKTSLQDDYENLQETLKFDTDQLTQQVFDSKQENEALKADIQSLMALLESEKEHNQKLSMQLQEDKQNTSREHLKDLQILELEKQSSEMMSRCEEQEAKMLKLEQSLAAAEECIASLQKTNAAEKDVVSDLMSQITEMRTSVCQKMECIEVLTSELEDLKHKYTSALVAKEESKTILEDQTKQIEGLREALERAQAADSIEKEILSEELLHTTEQLSRLTEASKNHAALLQSAQEDIIRKEILIQELQEQLSKKTEELEHRRIEYESKIHQLDCVMDSSAEALPQTPQSPSHFDANLAKLLETHEQEIANQRAATITLESLVTELNEEREAKNKEILRLKGQLCELENMRLEMQVLMENNRNLQSQLEESRRGRQISGTNNPDIQELRKKEKELTEERLSKNKLEEELLKVRSELERTRGNLEIKELTFHEMVQEMERLRALESTAFEQKQQMRSKLEETCEERIKMEMEMALLRKQIETLAEENGKLVGHQNVNQKIQYLVKLKKEHAKLMEEVDILRAENACLKGRSQES
ncbi:kinesin-like protein KIF15 [Anolis sagrei]|uniref:kinesin-like protein KIF15 n=1 Tax=Anolis sagrei TaxID=38937 RepID=UPI00352009BE